MKKNAHLGSSLDDLLREDGALEEVEALAQKRTLARQLERLMKERQVNKATLARLMGTSRSALDRLLDPLNASVTLHTLASAARALGSRLELRLSHGRRPSARATARRASATSVRRKQA